MFGIRRRKFITLLGGAAAWPMAARAQQRERVLLRWGGDDINRMRALAQELVGLQPDIIATTSTAATAALQRETGTFPIVFVSVADSVASGLVPRLNQPGGNITGFANYEATLGGKWLELLSEIASGLKRAAIMFNPDTAPYRPICPHLRRRLARLRTRPGRHLSPHRHLRGSHSARRKAGRSPGAVAGEI